MTSMGKSLFFFLESQVFLSEQTGERKFMIVSVYAGESSLFVFFMDMKFPPEGGLRVGFLSAFFSGNKSPPKQNLWQPRFSEFSAFSQVKVTLKSTSWVSNIFSLK